MTTYLAPAPTALPRARALTEELLSPLVSIPNGRLLAQDLGHVIDEAVSHGAPGCIRIGAFQLASATCAPLKSVKFRWTARRARRAIGLVALRRLVEGHATTPADAVTEAIGDPGALGAHGPGSCADWLDSLSASARAAVRAEATTWATQFFYALEWERLDPAPLVGAPDRWWVRNDQPRVALRGRADVRLAGAGGVHLSLLAGHPTAKSRMALCLSALVDLLVRGQSPSRVAGWWPEAGKAWIVPIDADTLFAVADLVGRAAGVRGTRARRVTQYR